MASIELTPRALIVHITGLDRVLSMHSHLEVPLAHVTDIQFAPDEAKQELTTFWHDTSMPGAVAPAKSLVGTYTEHGDRIFWDVHHADRAVTLNLKHHRYAKVIVEVAHPEQTVQEIQDALQPRVAAGVR